MTAVECGNCGRVSHDGAALCVTCTAELKKALLGCPDLLDDLLTTLAKQDRLGTAGGKRGKGSEQPLPVRLDIPDEIWTLGNTLTTWARDVAETAGLQVDASHLARRRPPTALDSLRFAATWMADHIGQLRRLAAADQAHDEISYAINSANAACSAPPLRVFVGSCNKCEADLYGWPDHRAVKCGRCDTEYRDMAERWNRALFRLRGYPATAALIAGSIGELYDVLVSRKLINSWHHRGTLAKVDHDPDTGDPRFRIGEVLDRASKSRPRKAG